MTKREFEEKYKDGNFGDLIDFCVYENSEYSEFIADIYSDSDRDDYINNWLEDAANHYSWGDILHELRCYEDDGSYSWWRFNEWGDGWSGLDENDYADLYESLLKELIEDDFFEYDEEVDKKEADVELMDMFS